MIFTFLEFSEVEVVIDTVNLYSGEWEMTANVCVGRHNSISMTFQQRGKIEGTVRRENDVKIAFTPSAVV